MTKEKAIMEIMSNAKQVEALDTCIKILEGWSTMEDLAVPLKQRIDEIERKSERLCDIAGGGKFDIGKAF